MTRARAIIEHAADVAIDTACRVLRLPTNPRPARRRRRQSRKDQPTYRRWLVASCMPHLWRERVQAKISN